jgi:hypothetical protein
MLPAISLKTVTNNVGWSARSKTSTFGLKFVTVPILARQALPQTVAQTVVRLLAAKVRQPVRGCTRVERRYIVQSSTKGDIR